MSTETNKQNFRRIPMDVFNKGNVALLNEIVASDYIEHVPPAPGWPTGIEGLKQFVTMLRKSFPDLTYTLDDTIGEGDMAAGQATVRGTHLGELPSPMGMIPPTGKQATWTEMHIGRYANGKLVEHWAEVDTLGMMQQLGLATAPGQA